MSLTDYVGADEINSAMQEPTMGDPRYWSVPIGKSTIRFLPRLESKVPWKKVVSHRSKGNNVYATCPKTFNDFNCPVCKKAWAMKSSETLADRTISYECRPTTRYLMNVYIVNDCKKPENNGLIKVLSIGKKLYELITEAYNSSDLGVSIFDIENGFDFQINKKQVGDDFPDYSSSRFVSSKSKITSEKEILTKLYNIDEMITRESVEELKKKFAFLGDFTVLASGNYVAPSKGNPSPTTPPAGNEPPKNEPENKELNDSELDDEIGKILQGIE